MVNFEMQNKTGISGAKTGSSTQTFLEISEIKDDAIVTSDGGLRAVVAVSSTNFVLKSQDEQQAIIAHYQAFLNAQEFSLQILMQSRHLDIHGYLEKIQARQMQQTNELLRMQTEEYIAYIGKLLEFGNIMNKTFYIVIPYSSGDTVKTGLVDKLKNLINPAGNIVVSRDHFQAGLSQLEDRVARVSGELGSMGLRTMRLNTQELVELLFNSYNVSSAQKGRVDIGELDVT